MVKEKDILEKLKCEVSDQIGDFLRKYYEQDTISPYLKEDAIKFMEKCRYRNDDVRPLLTKLGYEICGGDDMKRITPAMAAIHSLLLGFMPLDDIIDGATKQNFKNPEDFAKRLALAYSLSTKLKESCRNILRKYYGNSNNYIEIDSLISECCERLDGSHTLEVNIHNKKTFEYYSIHDYFDLIDEATSVLIATSFVIGGLITGINEKTKNKMWNFGMNLGRLCQIRDDFLDYVNPKITGKVPFADLCEKRKRFPILVSYKFGNSEQRKKIEKIFRKSELSKKDVLEIIEVISQRNIVEESKKIINEASNSTLENLKGIPKIQPSHDILSKLVNLFSMKEQL